MRSRRSISWRAPTCVHNASSYKKEPEENSIHGFNHLIFRRAGDARPGEIYECITGKVEELELPKSLEDISSTRIRENIDKHRDISSLIDPVVQEYIYHKGLYLREPEYKPIVRAKAISFENQGQPGWEVLGSIWAIRSFTGIRRRRRYYPGSDTKKTSC